MQISVVSVGPNKLANNAFGKCSIHILSCFVGITSPANNIFSKYGNLTSSKAFKFATIHSADGTQ